MVLLLLLVLPTSASAAEAEEKEPEQDSAESPHRVGLFLGITHAEGEDNETVGASYEYRLQRTPLLGVGGVIEYARGDLKATGIKAALYFHPVVELRFLLGAGNIHAHSENAFVVRAAVGYEFRVGNRFSISPEFNLDSVEGETVTVYGVSVGWSF